MNMQLPTFLLSVVLLLAVSNDAQDDTISSDAPCRDKFSAKNCYGYRNYCHGNNEKLKQWAREKCPVTCGVCKPQCGISKVQQSRVVAGEDAQRGAWPWIVAMYRAGRYVCGGTLISPTVVLTASHCTRKNSNPRNYYFLIGAHDRNRKDGMEQYRKVKRILDHPNYKPVVEDSDITLMYLEEPVFLNDRVQLACLPDSERAVPAKNERCYLAGWGKIKHPGGSVPVLQQAHLEVVPNDVCHKLNFKNYKINVKPTMLCAGHGPKDRRGGCHGDSGGPFVCQTSGGAWQVHGVVSWGSGKCDTSLAYTVFTRVSKYLGWIKRNM